MISEFFMILSFALFALGISGVAATRHFLLMILSIEVALVSATLLAVTFFYYSTQGNIMLLLFSIWGVAAAEAMVLIAFYRYMSRFEMSLDVTRLSKFKE